MTTTESTARAPRHFFKAAIPGGELGLSLPTQNALEGASSGRCMLDAAAALARVEVALCGLEDWLGAGLRPMPIEAARTGEEHLMFRRHVYLRHSQADIDLFMPWDAIATCPSPSTPAMAAWVWAPIHCELVLDCMNLALVETDQLAVGAMLVLPASFGVDWRVRLQPLVVDAAPFAAEVEEVDGMLSVRPSFDTLSAIPSESVRVSVAQPVAVPPAVLFAWDTAEADDPVQVPLTDPLAVIDCARSGGQPLGLGRLVPMGNGRGLRLENVAGPAASQQQQQHDALPA